MPLSSPSNILKSILKWFKGNSRELEDLAQKNPNQLTSEDVRKLRDTYGRFRVLVLGPMNAGKTTLLERLNDSPAGAAIVTRNGARVTEEAPKRHSLRRSHRINDEITYPSNPGFVFHESGGFEAGANKEVKAVRNFIRKRSSASPSDQVHAIWLCIPTDNDRPFGSLDIGFFSKHTGSVPVIGIFTKLDERRATEQVKLLGRDPSRSDIALFHSRVEQKTGEFVDGLVTEFRRLPHPPAAFIRIGRMHNENEQSTASCNQLLERTINALTQGAPKLLLGVTIGNKKLRTHNIYVLHRMLAGGLAGRNIVQRSPTPGRNEESELRADRTFRALVLLLLGVEPDRANPDLEEKEELDKLRGEWAPLWEKRREKERREEKEKERVEKKKKRQLASTTRKVMSKTQEMASTTQKEQLASTTQKLPLERVASTTQEREREERLWELLLEKEKEVPREVQERRMLLWDLERDHGYWSEACDPLLALSRQLSVPSNPQARYLTFICLVVLCIRRGKFAVSPSASETEHMARSIQARIDDDLVDKGNGQMKSMDSRSMARRLAGIIDEYTLT